MNKHYLHATLAGLGALVPTLAQGAGGHYEVEDAELVDPSACELETWHSRVDADNHESNAILTCNPAGGFEIGAGAERLLEDGSGYDTIAEFNAKALLAQDESWAVGIHAADFRSHNAGQIPEWEVRLPVTLEPLQGLAVHLNAGWSWQRGQDNKNLWGLGAEQALVKGVNLIAETFGSDRGGSTFAQAGLRFELGSTELDLGYGRPRDNGDDSELTLGLIQQL